MLYEGRRAVPIQGEMQDEGSGLRQTCLKSGNVEVAIGCFVGQCDPLNSACLNGGLNRSNEGGPVRVGIASDEKGIRTRHANRTTQSALGSIDYESIGQSDLYAHREAVHAR